VEEREWREGEREEEDGRRGRGEEDRGISLQPGSAVPVPAKEVSFLYTRPFCVL
jgi:hypothetical protein